MEVAANNFMGEESEESFMYDSNLLRDLNFSGLEGAFKNRDVSPANPGPGLKIRSLGTEDYDRGFLQLLGQLTEVGDISRAEFIKRFSAMKNSNGTYYTTVIEDIEKGQVIGAATLAVEKKFIHNCATRGIIEDVIVNDQYRGRQLGKLIVATLSELAKSLGCYKITLNCKDEMVSFYTSLGFVLEKGNGNFLMIRVKSKPS